MSPLRRRQGERRWNTTLLKKPLTAGKFSGYQGLFSYGERKQAVAASTDL